MKTRNALTALLAIGIGIAGLADRANAQHRGMRGGRGMRADRTQQTDVDRSQFQEQRAFGLAGLDLTEKQQARLQELRQQMREQMQTFRENGERPSAEEIQAIREQHRAAIEKILTSGQIAQLEELRASRPEGRGWGGRGMRGGRGQRDGAGFSAFGLAGLDLTEEQQAQLQELRQQMREQMQTFRENGERPSAEEIQAIREQHRAAIEKILTSGQIAQLEELRASRPEGRGMRDDRYGAGAGLDLTEEQKARLQELRQQMREQMQTFRENGERPSAEEIQAIREQHRAAVEAILTSGTTTTEASAKISTVESTSWGAIKAEQK